MLISETELIDVVIEVLRDIPEVRDMLDGNTLRIGSLKTLHPLAQNLTDAIGSMSTGEVMLVHLRTALPAGGAMGGFIHSLAMYIRFVELEDGQNFIRTVLTGTPSNGDGMNFLQCRIHEACDPISDVAYDRAQDKDGNDLYQMTFALQETGA